MDYKIKYHDALEGIRELYNSDCDMIRVKRLRRRLEHIFPELKESEDERIRKGIIRNLQYLMDRSEGFVKEDLQERIVWLESKAEQSTDKIESNPAWSEEDEKMLKWLCRIIHTLRLDRVITLKEESELGEWMDKWLNYNPQTKQSEHLTDKIKPRFKEGDWITDGRITCKVLGVTSKSYELHLHNDDYCHFETDIQSVDKYYRLWTIQDAKDGDVLVCEDENFTIPFIAIYKCLGDTVYNYKGLKDLTFNSHCFMGFNGNFYEGEGGHVIEGIHPATKEQHNLLFRKMKEAGYEWNSEKKELKKVEQKPDDNVEPKFKPGDWIVFNGLILHIDEIVNGYYRTTSRGDDIHNSYDWDIDNAARLWTIQDAKDGDVLVDEDNNIGIYVGKNDDFWHSCIYLGCDNYLHGINVGAYHKHKNTKPATKEQRNLLFQKMKEEGYEWNAQKKEVKKSTDKVESRFKEGDFIMNNDITEDGKPEIFKIIKVCSSWYDVENVYDGRQTMITFSQDYTCHRWTIDDAKQGDILMVDNEFIVVLYRKITDGTEWKDTSILTEYEYDINDNTFTKGSHLFYCDICPATYAQREVLTNYIQQVLNWEK